MTFEMNFHGQSYEPGRYGPEDASFEIAHVLNRETKRLTDELDLAGKRLADTIGEFTEAARSAKPLAEVMELRQEYETAARDFDQLLQAWKHHASITKMVFRDYWGGDEDEDENL